MRKLLAVLMAIALCACLLVGCSGSPSVEEEVSRNRFRGRWKGKFSKLRQISRVRTSGSGRSESRRDRAHPARRAHRRGPPRGRGAEPQPTF